MFKIGIYEGTLGGSPTLYRKGERPDRIANRNDAIQLIEQHTASFDEKGWNSEQDYWWCRNNTDTVNQVLIIEPASS